MKPLIACLLFVSACSINTANADRLDYLAGLNNPEYVRFDSEIMERPFHIFIRLPEDFEKDKKYSVVYLLDGDIAFPLLASYHLLLSFDEPMIDDAIIVGISYGTHDPENGNYRRSDYSTPTEGGSGQADVYQTFLKSELLPYIEKNYPADPDRRIIVGQSRGAHFVLYTAFTQPDLFWGHIASNPSLSPDKVFFFTDHKLPPSTKTNLFFANGSNDWPALRADSLELFDHLAKQNSLPWRLKTITLADETHAAGLTNVYRAGLKWFFSNDTVEGK
jgi:predicted alpha/beta superfamily hydrolase